MTFVARQKPALLTLILLSAVAVLPVAVFMAAQMLRIEVEGPGFAAGKFVVGAIALSDDASVADATRIRSRQLEPMSRLQVEPGVSAVAFSSSMPGFAPSRWIEFEDAALRDGGSPEVSTLDVGVEMFETYGAQILAGVTIGSRSVIGAGSVVTRDVPEGVLAAGNPCRVIRAIAPDDARK